MRKAKERGKTAATPQKENPYWTYFEEAISKMIEDGIRFPALQKITGGSTKVQFQAHVWVMDELKGLYDRHCMDYEHLSKVHYRAMYLGAKMLLEEEKANGGKKPDRAISKLEKLCEKETLQHKFDREMDQIRKIVRQKIEDMRDGIISESEFEVFVEGLLADDLYDSTGKAIKARVVINEIVEKETLKVQNVARQKKHRSLIGLVK